MVLQLHSLYTLLNVFYNNIRQFQTVIFTFPVGSHDYISTYSSLGYCYSPGYKEVQYFGGNTSTYNAMVKINLLNLTI